MSFSHEIKEEAGKQIEAARHCRLAELSAFYDFLKEPVSDSEKLAFKSENFYVIRKCFTLLNKSYNIYTCEKEDEGIFEKNSSYYIKIDDENISNNIKLSLSKDILLLNTCCKRAYLRGAFLAAGSMSDPEKGYHLEIVCKNEALSDKLIGVMEAFDLEAKKISRKNYFVVYLKESEKIVDFLNIIKAHISLMTLENTRILKDVRNSVNRRVNCETANLNKTVVAAVKQAEAIELLMQSSEYEKLPESLKMIARLRLDNPNASLSELSRLCDPPVGKSGVNHRLRKLMELADDL